MPDMHEHGFPASDEPPQQTSDRFIAALQYEERARLGFRRQAVTTPVPGGAAREEEWTHGQIWGGYLAAIALALGVGSLVFKPLLLGPLALVLGIGSLIPGGPAERLGRIALIVAGVCWVLGMIVHATLEMKTGVL